MYDKYTAVSHSSASEELRTLALEGDFILAPLSLLTHSQISLRVSCSLSYDQVSLSLSPPPPPLYLSLPLCVYRQHSN